MPLSYQRESMSPLLAVAFVAGLSQKTRSFRAVFPYLPYRSVPVSMHAVPTTNKRPTFYVRTLVLRRSNNSHEAPRPGVQTLQPDRPG